MVNWNSYLESICTNYADWWNIYTVTNVVGTKQQRQNLNSRLLDLGLRVQTVESEQEKREEREEKTEQFTVLEGLRKYASDHVLLVGRPGSGKSTALARLLLEEAEKAKSQPESKIPVLVELRYLETSLLSRIRAFLHKHDPNLNLDEATLKNWLLKRNLLLLLDGFNELSTEKARQEVRRFRLDYPHTPMIFTTRDLGIGGDLKITKKLEMLPLTETQMREFVNAYLPEQGEQMLKQLGNRLREFGQTPLLLWMLCSVFVSNDNSVPSNLGSVFRRFTESYNLKLKQDIPVSEESRRWWSRLLQCLAWTMTQGNSQTEIQVAISRHEAEEKLAEFLQGKVSYPADSAISWLDDLLKYHLIQRGAENQIAFRHQLIQEYYAAENLLRQLPSLSDDELKWDYLNYLKWTETIALVLGIVGDRTQAVRVVKLGLEVDWQLGARLAGEIRSQWQEETVDLVLSLEVPELLKIRLWGLTKSDIVIPKLIKFIYNQDSFVRWRAVEALGKIGTEAVIPGLLNALSDEDYSVLQRASEALGKIGTEAAISPLIEALEDDYSFVRSVVAESLGKIGNDRAISPLIKALENGDSFVRSVVAESLGKIGNDRAISPLIKALEDGDSFVCWSVSNALAELGSEAAIPILIQRLKDEDPSIRSHIVDSLGKIGTEAVISSLIQALKDEDHSVRTHAVIAYERISMPYDPKTLLLNTADNSNTFYHAMNALKKVQARCQYYNIKPKKPQIHIPPAQPITNSLMYILHLSDLHFGTLDQANLWSGQLAQDLREELDINQLNCLILSGDIANKSTPEEYQAAKSFINKLCIQFHIQTSQIVIVPGNHDLNWALADKAQYKENGIIKEDETRRKRRFDHFISFYKSIKDQPYPLDYEDQGILQYLPSQKLLFLGLNSAWKLDRLEKKDANINPQALTNALNQVSQNQELYRDCLKIAVWHHPLDSPDEDRIKDRGFMERLAQAGFRLALHGHIHKAENSLYKYDHTSNGRKLDIICAGTFGASTGELVTATPWQYNLLKFENNQLTVHTRKRESENGAWESDARWRQGQGRPSLDYYTINLSQKTSEI
ncbi:MAG: HEAT repeat domain-containing protein [Xenococcus sp. MO_188.B8]|nr:HEAT repeat domain-containing protein [Xenococcus sp. MO_188.B8]